MAWAEEIVDAIYKGLKPDENDIVLHVENMDTKRLPLNEGLAETTWGEILTQVYAQKYKNISFTMVLSSDDNAYTFLVANYNRLFQGYEPPVVHCGVNDWSKFGRSEFDRYQLGEPLSSEQSEFRQKHFAGAAEIPMPRETVQLMKKLIPGLKTIYAINDATETGQLWAKWMEIELRGVTGVDVKLPPAFRRMAELEQFLGGLDNSKRDIAVLLGVFYRDQEGSYFSFERQTELISAAAEKARVPVFGLLDFQLSHGIVGGVLIGGKAQGEAMCKVASAILAGSSPEIEGVVSIRTGREMFDATRAQRFGIDLSGHLPPKRFEWSGTMVAAAAAITFLFVLLLLWLGWLVWSHSVRYRNLYSSRLAGLFQTTEDGSRFLRMTPKLADMLGCLNVQEAIRSMPPWAAYQDPKRRDELLQILRRDGKVDQFDFELKRKDGSLRDVSLGAVLYTGYRGRGYLEGAIVDVTELEKQMLQRGNELFGSPQTNFLLPDVFVLTPFDAELEHVYKAHIKAVCEGMNLRVARGDGFARSGSVMRQIWSAICGAKFVIADLTRTSANVFYEVGIAHALGKDTILISQSAEDIPFNTQHLRTIIYDSSEDGLKKFRADLTQMLCGA